MTKKMISFEIPDDLREALRIKAFNEKMSMSSLIRALLEAALANEKISAYKESEKEDYCEKPRY